MTNGMWYLRIDDFKKTGVGHYEYKGKLKNQIVDMFNDKAYFAPFYKPIVFISDKGAEVNVSDVGVYVQMPLILNFPLISAEIKSGDDIAKYSNFYYKFDAVISGTLGTITLCLTFTKDNITLDVYV